MNDDAVAPTYPSSAIGPRRFIQVNQSTTAGNGLTVWNHDGDDSIDSAPLYALVGCFDLSTCDHLSSPSLLWDPSTRRFYATAEEPPAGPGQDGYLLVAWSRTAAPTADSDDWCHFAFNAGPQFVDRTKIGDSKDFVVVGENSYDGVNERFTGSHLWAVAKPGKGSGCAANITGYHSKTLVDTGGDKVRTPAPANGIDPSPKAWAVARSHGLPSKDLWLFSVSRSPRTGRPVFDRTGSAVRVGRYSAAGPAPQKGTSYTIGTGDGSPTQAVVARDPSRHTTALWTQQTIAHGGRSAVRWMEIDAARARLLQRGLVSPRGRWAFNAAISSDRAVNGRHRAFGQNMVLGYDTTSRTSASQMWVVTKRGGAPVTDPVHVINSGGPANGYDCRDGSPCRWEGAAASPDPLATGSAGQVFMSEMLTYANDNPDVSNGATWNAAATP